MKADDYTKLDQYLQNELPEAERAAFEARLQTEADLAAELQLRQQMDTYLRTQQQLPSLQEKMAALGKQHFAQTDKPRVRQLARRRLFYVLGAAAAVALVLLVWNPFSRGNLYEQFAQHPPLALVERAENQDLATQAEQALESNEFAQAYDLLKELLAANPDNPQLLLALGISALETDRSAEASRYFTELANGSTALSEYGSWYLILTAIKDGNQSLARQYLDGQTFTDPYLQAQADRLEQQLE